jgi:tellurite resistance protein TerC
LFIVQEGRLRPTHFFLALVVIEISDLIFALDSIPAILAITPDPFIVYSSNVFAILGLRSLYFAVSRAAQRIQYLHYGLAAILVFVGLKMALGNIVHISSVVTLGVIFVILAISVFVSWNSRKPTPYKPLN